MSLNEFIHLWYSILFDIEEKLGWNCTRAKRSVQIQIQLVCFFVLFFKWACIIQTICNLTVSVDFTPSFKFLII